MRLVKFKDGTYGVRRWWFLGWWFQDLHSLNVLFFRSRYFHDCKGSYEKALEVYESLKISPSKHEVIK